MIKRIAILALAAAVAGSMSCSRIDPEEAAASQLRAALQTAEGDEAELEEQIKKLL